MQKYLNDRDIEGSGLQLLLLRLQSEVTALGMCVHVQHIKVIAQHTCEQIATV